MKDFYIVVILLAMFTIVSWGVPTLASKMMTSDNNFYTGDL